MKRGQLSSRKTSFQQGENNPLCLTSSLLKKKNLDVQDSYSPSNTQRSKCTVKLTDILIGVVSSVFTANCTLFKRNETEIP